MFSIRNQHIGWVALIGAMLGYIGMPQPLQQVSRNRLRTALKMIADYHVN